MKRTPLRRRTPLARTQALRLRASQGLAAGRRSTLKRSQPLAWRSDKRKDEMAEYVPLMLAFLAENAWCDFPGCGAPSQVLHHRRGREGRRLLDQTWWAASCNPHNDYAETHTGEALKAGWLVRINSNGDAG